MRHQQAPHHDKQGTVDKPDKPTGVLLDQLNGNGYGWRQAACGIYHSACLNDNGKLMIWGTGQSGALGLGSEEADTVARQPVPVSFPIANLLISQIACGAQHTLALSMRHVWAWGDNTYGQLGVTGERAAVFEPVSIKTLEDGGVRQVSCGSRHSLALSDTSELFSWGLGTSGQLGLGDRNSTRQPMPIRALKMQGVTLIGSRWEHCFAITECNDLYMWGLGASGQLGIGIGSQAAPVPARASRPLDCTVRCRRSS
jgi:alpha-tubulin suppressor-like RCC1 family protein